MRSSVRDGRHTAATLGGRFQVRPLARRRSLAEALAESAPATGDLGLETRELPQRPAVNDNEAASAPIDFAKAAPTVKAALSQPRSAGSEPVWITSKRRARRQSWISNALAWMATAGVTGLIIAGAAHMLLVQPLAN